MIINKEIFTTVAYHCLSFFQGNKEGVNKGKAHHTLQKTEELTSRGWSCTERHK